MRKNFLEDVKPISQCPLKSNVRKLKKKLIWKNFKFPRRGKRQTLTSDSEEYENEHSPGKKQRFKFSLPLNRNSAVLKESSIQNLDNSHVEFYTKREDMNNSNIHVKLPLKKNPTNFLKKKEEKMISCNDSQNALSQNQSQINSLFKINVNSQIFPQDKQVELPKSFLKSQISLGIVAKEPTRQQPLMKQQSIGTFYKPSKPQGMAKCQTLQSLNVPAQYNQAMLEKLKKIF